MPFTAIATSVAGNVASGLVGKLFGGKKKSNKNKATGGSIAAGVADPFASQRGQYQKALASLMNGGESAISKDPSYKFRFQQGEEALLRAKASTGLAGSGNQNAALVEYGQNMGSQEYQNQYSRLSHLAGADIGSPGAAAQILSGQQDRQQAGATALASTVGNAVSSAVPGAIKSVSDWWNTPKETSNQKAVGGNISNFGGSTGWVYSA